ncbi:MAG: hypothetical protein LC742_09535 [Acidobacteria bacterium]|nr:hypothetical protein [Acidobacteriota bacterium]
MNELAALDERKSRVVEMKFFGGLDTEEIGEVLNISPEPVKRDWRFARTWLLCELAHRRFRVRNYPPLPSTVDPHFGSVDWLKRLSIKRSFEVTFVAKNSYVISSPRFEGPVRP